jgi:hypothetical protein
MGRLYIGGVIDPASGERSGEPLLYDSDAFTTHGVIVGMTGSGKTGLGIGILEETLLRGVPCLVIDPKGDMGNLLLNFPELTPDQFRPWIDESEAQKEGITPDDLAAQTAELWRSGLESWDIDPARMEQLRDAAGLTIYTPGSSAGVPLNILGSLTAPPGGFEADPETHRDEIEGYVSSLLTLAGVESDPVSGPEHILLATVIERAWAAGSDLDLAGLISQTMKPPFRKLGVFELDTFFPEKQRTALAMKLNGLIASPSFAAWLDGMPLDIEAMLWRDGRPQGAIVYLSHLSDTERRFVVTLLLSKVVTWMRSQSGTSDLRALIYMDEVFGFAPPTAEPPSKKPILTILKQARAFGVGMILSTQNPVDLDYKAMSNAGTWMIGRLQTERDKARILEGLASASGGVDVPAFDVLISGLGKRQFVLQSAKGPQVFTTRWVMSYLAGPLTRHEVERLSPSAPVAESAAPSPTAASPPGLDEDSTTVAPAVAKGIPIRYVDPAAAWIGGLGCTAGGNTLEAGAVATVRLRYDDRHAGVDHTETFEAIVHPIATTVDAGNLHVVDHDPRDFVEEAPPGAAYRLPEAAIDQAATWKSLASSLTDHLERERRVTVWKNTALSLYSRVGESEGTFRARCAAAAEDAADTDIAALKGRFETRIEAVKGRISTAERRVRELDVDVETRRQQEVLSGAGDLLGALLGGRRSSALGKAASRRSQTRRTEARLETAEEALSGRIAELDDLEADLADEVLAITGKWNAATAEMEPVEIPLERSDIAMDPPVLVWLPFDR